MIKIGAGTRDKIGIGITVEKTNATTKYPPYPVLIPNFILRRTRKQTLHLWVRVDQAVRPLPPKTLNILVGLSLKLISLCNHN